MKFLSYTESHFAKCIYLFDENCPEFFAENERQDYRGFLQGKPLDYFVGLSDLVSVCAFGVIATSDLSRTRLSWILVSPRFKGNGVGMKMMNFAKEISLQRGASTMDIAASHLSSSFFAKSGAQELGTTPNGWGPGMHRIDMEIKLK